MNILEISKNEKKLSNNPFINIHRLMVAMAPNKPHKWRLRQKKIG
jgi:hypothetical protein